MKKAFFRISVFYVRGELCYFPRSISPFLQIVGVLVAGLIVPSTDPNLLQRALTSYCPLLTAFGILTSLSAPGGITSSNGTTAANQTVNASPFVIGMTKAGFGCERDYLSPLLLTVFQCQWYLSSMPVYSLVHFPLEIRSYSLHLAFSMVSPSVAKHQTSSVTPIAAESRYRLYCSLYVVIWLSIAGFLCTEPGRFWVVGVHHHSGCLSVSIAFIFLDPGTDDCFLNYLVGGSII